MTNKPVQRIDPVNADEFLNRHHTEQILGTAKLLRQLETGDSSTELEIHALARRLEHLVGQHSIRDDDLDLVDP